MDVEVKKGMVDSSREELGESVGRESTLQRRMHSRNSTMLDAFPMHDDISFLCAAHGNRQCVLAKPSRTRAHTSQNPVAKEKKKNMMMANNQNFKGIKPTFTAEIIL